MPTDFERGAKVAGSKFYFTVGQDAGMEWELINHMINFHRRAGYEFVIPPFLVNKDIAEMAGILPRFEGDFYETTDGQILIPTAETPLVGMHSWEIFEEEELPKRYVAISPCFRKEAGAAGSKNRGLRRVHQFHKVELFVICKPEDSEYLHQSMLAHVEELMDSINKYIGIRIDRRVIELPEWDRSPVSNKTYDIELLCDDEWLEVSSISNTGDNQSKPAQIRYRPKEGGKPIKCHLLNGSGVALPRLLLAIRDKLKC